MERTLSIIKPDGVEKNIIGKIYSRFEKAGLKIVEAKMLHLSREQAEGFYAVHKERPFFNDLVDYMTSGPVMVQVLEGEDAINLNRKLPVKVDCIFTFKYLHHNRSRSHIINQVIKERSFFMNGIKSFCLFSTQMQHFCFDDF